MSEYGLGWIPSPLDPRDFPISQLYALRGIEKPLALPASYTVPDLPPVLDQDGTPQCVAYSTSELKAQEDRIDQGQFFNFDQARFFGQIGGTSQGAVIRVALDQVLHVGYPVVGSTDGAKDHKIANYYAVPVATAELQAAIMSFGPLVIGMDWDSAFDNPPASGILRKPSGVIRGGHAILVVGWVTISGVIHFLLQNSWGVAWGLAGRCYLAASYVAKVVGEAWKAVDVIEPPVNPPTPPRTAMTYHSQAPARAYDSRLADGPVGPHTPRTFPIIGQAGVAADAVCVAGNLTVAGATGGGYLVIGPDPVTNPTTSRLNFPKGDDRANSFIALLGPDGTLSVTYVGPAGAKVHVVVDIDGYFTA